MCVCLCTHISVCVCLSVCVHVHIYLCVCVFLCVCMYMCVRVFVCVHAHAHTSIYRRVNIGGPHAPGGTTILLCLRPSLQTMSKGIVQESDIFRKLMSMCGNLWLNYKLENKTHHK